ncbi:MAG: tellurite resistance protein TerB [Motiliproteus sp.]|jgi:tellurite resistance protein TerB
MFKNILKQGKEKFAELKTEALKYKSKDFLNAALGGSALVAYADGSIDPEEKQKMIAFIQHNEALSIYDTSEAIKCFNDHVETFGFDYDIGRAKAMQAIGKMRGKEEQARLIIRMVIAIAASDGDFDAQEKVVAIDIAKELGLDPAEFSL